MDAVREWSFDTGILGRSAFYLLLPSLSWVASSLVERLVGVFFER